nr:23S ribosomal RNA methyltransferase Erm [Evansella caseinilytica]
MTKKTHKYSSKKLSRGEPPNFSGQHFMHNKKLLTEMVHKAKVGKSDTVLELGAGKGALTTVLGEKAGKVLAVEYDAQLVGILKQKTAEYQNTKIIHQDILSLRLPKEKFVVVSNIPYAITTPIMKWLLHHPATGLQRGVIVMEKGAARRFTAKTVKNVDVLAWRMWFDIRYVKGISRDNFSPPPSVDSAMVYINRKKAPMLPTKDYAAFLGLVEYALKEPRASIDTALRGIFTSPQLKRLKQAIGASAETPIGMLAENQWGVVFNSMTQYVQRSLWPRITKSRRRRWR